MRSTFKLWLILCTCTAGVSSGQEAAPQAKSVQQTKSDRPLVAGQTDGPGKAKKKKDAGPKITISKETTWVTEPILPSGYIDYLAAVNHHFSQGVTKENNAAIKLYQALGPAPENGRRQPDQFFRLMGIEPIPDEGPYFEELDQWWQRNNQPKPPEAFANINELATRTQTKPWTSKEFPEVAEWLRDNAETLSRVQEATECTEYFSPLVSANGDEGSMFLVQLPGVQKTRSLARALMTRSMMYLGEHDSIKAWTDLITLHRLGRLVGRGPTLIEGLVGISIESMAIDAEVRLISEVRPSRNFITRYQKQIESLPARMGMTEKLNFSERICFLDSCQQFARQKMKTSDLLGNGGADDWISGALEGIMRNSTDWNEVLKSGNEWYDRIVIAAKLPMYTDRSVALDKIYDELKQIRVQSQGANVLFLLTSKSQVTRLTGNVLLSLLVPASKACMRAESRTQQRMRNLEIVFALSNWYTDHDSYPESLSDLAPKYLADVPVDLFSNGPLHYSRTGEGYLFYSVGENGIDDQGKTFGEQPSGDDLPVRMPTLAR